MVFFFILVSHQVKDEFSPQPVVWRQAPLENYCNVTTQIRDTFLFTPAHFQPKATKDSST